jgi:hypothetical protein
MSNYTPSTNFATKDALPSGDPLKIVKGTEINTEFVNIQTAIATKLDISSLYPVGSIYINATDSTNPGSLFGFGTWSAFGAGRVPVGFDSSNAMFDTASETGGSYDAVLVSHSHTFSGTSSGQSTTHNHEISIADNGHSHVMRGTNSGGGGGDPIAGTNQNVSINSTRPAFTGITASAGNASQDHNHTYSGTTSTQGSSATNANVQPYITVYMWRRTA